MTARARRGRAWWTAALAAVVVSLVAVAPPPARAADDDPLAWRRVDAGAPPVEVAVEDRTAGRTTAVSGRALLDGSTEIYLRSADVAEMLQAGRLWQATVRRLTLRVGDHDIRVADGSRLVALDDAEYLLPVPVLYADGDLWLPMVLVTDVLSRTRGVYIRWSADDRRVVLGQAEVNLVDVRVRDLTRAASVTLVCREPLSFRASSPEQGIIEIKVYGAQADLARLGRDGLRGLVRQVSCVQAEGHALVTVRVDDLVTRYRTDTVDDGRSIVLTVEEEQVSALPDPVPRGQAHLAIGSGPVDVTRRLDIRTVVIDPGHGGSDPGVAGAGGLLEKDINLAVARELADYLRRRDLDVVLTREDDTHLGLAERAETANTAGGDLFISLHCNGWFNDGARGLETYFLSPAKSDWTKSVEAVENQGHDEPGDVEFIVWDLVQNRYISASSDLAEVIQAGVCADLGVPDRGVRQAGFRVLVGAWMPAVLVEMGFLTHPDESRSLASGRYQRDLARAIGDAVVAYRDRAAQAGMAGDPAAGQAGEGGR